MNDAERLAQMRVASYTGQLPPELAKWAVAFIEDAMPHVQRVRRRNDLLQQAADQLPAISVRAKATAIADGLINIKRAGNSTSQFQEGSFDWCLASALDCDRKTPTSWRHVARLLEV